MLPVEVAVLKKADLASFVGMLTKDYDVFGPTKKENQFAFGPIKAAEDLSLDYTTTILPPKKYFHRPVETMFAFKSGEITDKGVELKEKQLLFGVHPCDVNSLLLLDRIYRDDFEDPYYANRRDNTVIVALNCSKVGENCFCDSFGTGPSLDEGYDLLLTDLGDRYLVQVGSPVGKEIAAKAGLGAADSEDFKEKEKVLRAVQNKIQKKLDTEDLDEILNANFNHPKWQEIKDECLACGVCTKVCPTCFCFSVVDKVDLTLGGGTRPRVWDSCLLLEFAEVAMGHNFRKERDARFKQRFYHKLSYFEHQAGAKGCVGCGRCITFCPKHIDIVDIANEITAGSEIRKPLPVITKKAEVKEHDHPYEPLKAVIKNIKQQTYDTTTYTLSFVDEKVQQEYTFAPGTFNMLTLFGIGEAPISISSCADEKGTFDHTIRAVGNVTKALTGYKVGDIIGVRGPYGVGWPVEEMKGKNVLLIAGGIGLAPLRPVIQHIKNRRSEYGKFEILYGARTPNDMLFTDEFEEMRRIPDTNFLLTTDQVPAGMKWDHNIGVVTTLFDQMQSVPENTVMVTCGPDIMMKFVVRGLLARGWAPEQMYVSLERRMNCGIKKCGKCQIGPFFCCQDGPVFNYAVIKDLPEAIF